jgi:glycolate oxidase FAD binding subunit
MALETRAWSAETLGAALAGRAGGAVRPATAADVVAGVQPTVVVEPTTEEGVAATLAFADAEDLKVVIRGGGTQLGLGTPPSGADILLSMRGLARLVEHEPGDMTATAEAGLTLADFQAALGAAGQWLALDPALPADATIGGIVATAASGAHRLRYGGVRDQIIGVRIVRADGTIAKGGGKVVKNVAGFDLPKLFTGSLGTLGAIVTATFRVYPREASASTVILRSSDGDGLGALAVRLLATALVPSAIDLTGVLGEAEQALAIRFEGSAAACADQVREFLALAGPLGATDETLTGAAEVAHWRAATVPPQTADQGGATVLLKAMLLPGDLRGWLTAVGAITARNAVTGAWRAHAGHGIAAVRLHGEENTLAATIAEARGLAVARRGSLIVEDASPSLPSGLDPWGPSPAIGLMRRIKAQFDPRGTLNPGRFIGGI